MADSFPVPPVTQDDPASRRSFLQQAGAATVATSLATGLVVPRMVHAAGSDILRVGLIGAGGRGTGAASDALQADPYAELTAVGDAFEDVVRSSLKTLKADPTVGSRVKVTDDHIFWGFDAYKQVIDSGVDVVLLTTTPHFRPLHLAYAVDRGKHTFVEKPVAVDAPGVRSIDQTWRKAKEKGLAIVSGLCWRYDLGVRETMQRIRDGAIGEIQAIESSYNAGTLWHRGDRPEWSRMEFQIRNWLYFTWLSGDHICEQAVHSLDKTAWLMGDQSPIRAVGLGGRQQRTDPKFGNIFDHHTVFYEYANGVRVYFTCRQQDGCTNHVDEYVIGTKGSARILDHRIEAAGAPPWKYAGPKPSMYLVEHQELFKSIRSGNPINNGAYMNNSSMIAIMGRMCTYTGRQLTWDECWNSQARLGPDNYTWGDVPVEPIAIPGVTPFA